MTKFGPIPTNHSPLDDYVSSNGFNNGAPRNFFIADPNGRFSQGAIYFCRSTSQTSRTQSLWTLDLATGTEAIEIDAVKLTETTSEASSETDTQRERSRETASGITSYSVDSDGTTIAFCLANTIYVHSIEQNYTNNISSESEITTPHSVSISPDGCRLGFCDGANFAIASPVGDDWAGDIVVKVLLRTNSDTETYGQPDFIAAEEIGRDRGFWWSPQSDRLLVTRCDSERVATASLYDPSEPTRPAASLRYPFAGTSNALTELFVCDLDGNTTELDWRSMGDEPYEYLTRVEWTDKFGVMVCAQTRPQTTLGVHSVDIDEATFGHIDTITHENWVELFGSVPTMSDHGLITIRDTETQRTLFCDEKAVTPPNLYVREFIGIWDSGVVLCASTSGKPESSGVYVTDLDLGATASLTGPGVHKAMMSETALLVSSQHPSAPGRKTRVVRRQVSPDSQAPVVVSSYSEDGMSIEDTSLEPPMSISPLFVDTSKAVRSAVLLPEGYNFESPPYPLPVIVDSYGGPHAQKATAASDRHFISQYIANQGYCVVITDGHGTPGVDTATEHSIAGDFARHTAADQVAALQNLNTQLAGVMDMNRVGIRGWSFGGFTAALCVMEFPDVFSAAVVGAPVADWSLYDTHYTERYLKTPRENPIGYDNSNLIAQAARFSRPILGIHGLADDNVLAANSLRLHKALLDNHHPSQLIAIPGATHMTTRQQSVDLLKYELSFFAKYFSQQPPMPSSTFLTS